MSTHSPPSGSPPAGERLARLEAQIEQLVLTAGRAHADLKEHIDWQRNIFEQTRERIVHLEKGHTQIRTHLRWFKGVWIALQSLLVAWLGWK
jgi:hypothetical protein